MKRRNKRYSAIFMVFVMLMSLLPSFLAVQPVLAEEGSAEDVQASEIENENRTIRLTYERTDANYENWDVWVWNTGVQDDNIDFTEFNDGLATAYIEVSPSTTEIGFIVRKNDWSDREPNGQEVDRSIQVNQQDPLTKVYITEGEEDFHTVPEVSGPELDSGAATFYYRDKELYLTDQMHEIESVELKINSETYDMTYEEDNERFVYEYLDFPEGEHDYSFLVTKNGETTEVTDPYNESSIVRNLDATIELSGTTQPAVIDYNQNAVLTLDVVNELDTGIRSLYADTSALGGPDQLEIDPELEEVTISVTEDTAVGVKEIPLTAVDEFGNRHNGSAEVEVKARELSGEDADFDWDEASIYFMLTDRFFDGNETNNDPYGLNYDSYEIERGTYQGGDFAGITERLDYLDDLGINTIWISPIVDNIDYDVRYENDEPYFAYHGYWASDFTKLNPHFGTMDEYHEMIDAAHDRGMKIMVDVVLNHTGYGLKDMDGNLPETEQPQGYPTNEDRAIFSDMLRQGPDVGDDEVTGELAGLPDLITEDPAVREQIINWQTDWLKSATPNGNTIDYFRVDTVKHVEDTTWMAFKNELTREMPEFKMIGESWGAGQSNDNGYLESGMMDSLLDFEFKNTARDFSNGSLEAANSRLETRNEQLDNTATLGQFLGSHDEEGFLDSVEGDKGKLMVASALQMTAKGQPVIYYGEELGLSGANNYPFYDNRYDMPWDEIDAGTYGGLDVFEHYQKLLSFRGDNSEVFAKGDRSQVAGSDAEEFLLFNRSFNGESVYIGLNVAGEQEVTLDVDSADVTVTDSYSGKTYEANAEQEVTITFPAREAGGTVLLTAAGGEIISSSSGDGDDTNTLRVHYETESNDFSDLGLWVWEDVVSPSENWPMGALQFSEGGTTDYGAYVDVELIEGAERVSLLVNNSTGDNLTGDINLKLLSAEMNEIWLSEEGDVSLIKPVELPENTVRLHYLKEDQAYEPWRVWTWEDVLEPTTDWPDGAHPFSNEQVGKHGAYIDLDLVEDAQEIGFLFLNPDNDEQTGDMTFSDLQENDHIYVREGDLTVYSNPYYVFEEGLDSGELVSEVLMELRFSSTEDFSNEELAAGLKIVDKDGNDVSFDEVSKNDDGQTVNIHGSFDVNATPYDVIFMDNSVSVKEGWRFKDAMYGYEGDLGVDVHEDGSATLKVWSPSADSVSIVLYDAEDQYDIVTDDVEMTRGDRGVWEVTLNEENTGEADLTGFYYHYDIERDGESVLALDPYAKSMATWDSADVDNVPIGKAAIVDPSAIGPELEFADIDGFEKREDAIIYEIHVRDFTSDPDIDDELEAQFGTFASFVEKLDYIEDLGVTHVQMLPVMSYFFADEFNNDERLLDYSSNQNNYNWGYDPHSYFSLTGMYSEDPDDAEKRIEEFKMLVDEIHDRGMGVVLDVVYNHTAREEIFENLEPEYYHFMNADGTSRTSFGGGRLGTTHDMSRRILVDSIMHWVDEYKVDGFRFDMMGDHDAESIQMAYDEAKAANPNIVMIGEGWRTFAGDEIGGDVMPADQDWMQHTEAVGSFSDEMRNELKSGFGSEGQPRFLTGGARNIQQIFDNVTANPHNFTADDPGDVVPYIAAHDNLTLHDVIAQSIKKDPDHFQEEIHQRIRLGNLMVLTSQGTSFIHAGQEFGRTKQFRDDDYKQEVAEAPNKSTFMESEDGTPFDYPYFIHDSYDSTDAINMIEWDKATDEEAYPIHNQTREYTTGLIELRRSTDAFSLGTMDEITERVSLIDAPEINEQDLIIGYRTDSTDDTGEYFVFVNTDDQARTLTMNDVDLTEGVVVVDDNESGTVEVADPTGFALSAQHITIDPLTAIVVKIGGKTAADMISDLDDMMSDYVQSGAIRGPLVNQLGNTVRQAKHHESSEHQKQAVKFMEKFLKQLDGKQSDRYIENRAKSDLEYQAEKIMKQL